MKTLNKLEREPMELSTKLEVKHISIKDKENGKDVAIKRYNL